MVALDATDRVCGHILSNNRCGCTFPLWAPPTLTLVSVIGVCDRNVQVLVQKLLTTCFSLSSYQFVYYVYLICGIGTLMPWNCFITANDVSSFDYLGPFNVS